jgi:hypothetical protein
VQLHSEQTLIPSTPVGRPHCSFCHWPRPRQQLIRHSDKTGPAICFSCVAKAVKLLGKPVK